MLSSGVLNIYSSSAGSGKTYILVIEYLLILFQKKDPFYFKYILGITFTNKGVQDMKERILQSLKDLSKGQNIFLAKNLSKSLGISIKKLQKKSKIILQTILHDYDNFSISTIDQFTYKIIRSFTLNFEIPQFFEIEMDINPLLKETVDILLSKLNNSKKSSQILVKFVMDKLHNNNIWDPREDLIKISNLLIEEQSILPIKNIKDHSLSDFFLLNKLLDEKKLKIKLKLKKESDSFFNLLKEIGILKTSFYYSFLPNFFTKLSKENIFENSFKSPFNNSLTKSIVSRTFYSKHQDIIQKKLIDSKKDQWVFYYNRAKNIYYKLISDYILFFIIQKNFILLSLLQQIDKILNILKKENNILFNVDINKLINNEIYKYSLPYFYERIGERYHHYFIDEFQDTSRLQWNNLHPLIENTLSENGTVLLVGDIKQSIYRWRNGEPEQFIDLIKNSSSTYSKKIKTLNINFRSYEEIIKFNNTLYNLAAKTIIDKDYKKIYTETTTQKILNKLGGYVELNFFLKNSEYFERTYLEIKVRIKRLLNQGYQLKNIAILVRKNEDGYFLAQKLNYDGIPVSSSESLLLKNIWAVQCLINLFEILVRPYDTKIRIDWLFLLIQNKKIILSDTTTLHSFFLEMITLPFESFFKKLSKYGILFDREPWLVSSLYDLTEMAIRAIPLNENSYIESIQFFLNFIFKSVQKLGNSIQRFLEYWEIKKNKESIFLPEDIDAIRIMTIHKSKGLQFQVVLLPFMHWNAFKEKNIGDWMDIDPKIFQGFNNFYVTIRSYMSKTNGITKEFYKKKLAKISFDNLNLLYVSTTRAIEQLIIFTCNEINNKKNTIAFYFKNYLCQKKLWIENQEQYSFGISQKQINNTDNNKNIISNKKIIWISEPLGSRILFNIDNENLYKTFNNNKDKLLKNLKYSNLLHKALSTIYIFTDVEIVLKKISNEYNLNKLTFSKLEKQILSIINHPDLKFYYQDRNQVFSEREILFNGKIFRPDRIIFYHEEIIIIDYKIGIYRKKHYNQIKTYMNALLNMGYFKITGILVYINKYIKVNFFKNSLYKSIDINMP